MKVVFFAFFLLNSILVLGQSKTEVVKLEIYGRAIDFTSSTHLPVSQSEIKKKSSVYVRVTNEYQIEKSGIQNYLNNLTIADEQRAFGDYIALLIVHYDNKKKESYYITSTDAGSYKNNVRYNYSCALVAAVYSFLPISFYEYGPDGDAYYHQYCKECEEE